MFEKINKAYTTQWRKIDAIKRVVAAKRKC